MSINFKAFGGLFTIRYTNDIEDMDLDILQESYAELDEEYQVMKNDCKELKKELDKLQEVIERKNPEERREKIKRKLENDKVILHNEDIPYEVRMKYIIDAYRKDQVKWGKLAAYAKHLEGEVVRLKEILITNGYTDNGVVGDSEPAKVISELKKKIKELEGNIVPMDVTDALIKIKQLESQIETFPLKAIKSQSFRSVIRNQEKYIKELQTLLDKSGIIYQPYEEINHWVVEGVDNVVDEAVRYGNSFRPLSIFINSPRQSMRVNYIKNLMASRPQEKELVKIVYSMMCSQEVGLNTKLYRNFLATESKDAAEEMKRTKFAAFSPCAIFSEGKGREDVRGLTDLCFLSFYNIKAEKRLVAAMNILRNDKNVLMASRSLSNEGLNILIPYKLKDMELPTQPESMTPDEMEDVYKNVYNFIADKYLDKLGLIPDYQSGHIEHLYIISYDSDLYYYPDAESMMIDFKEPVCFDDEKRAIMSIGGKIREAESLIAKCNLYEAEKVLLDCRELIISDSCHESDEAEMGDESVLPLLDDYLAQIRCAKEKIERVNVLMDEVDVDLFNQDTKTAHGKIVESQHILKSITGTCRKAIGKIMERVVNNEMKLGAINREIKNKQ